MENVHKFSSRIGTAKTFFFKFEIAHITADLDCANMRQSADKKKKTIAKKNQNKFQARR